MSRDSPLRLYNADDPQAGVGVPPRDDEPHTRRRMRRPLIKLVAIAGALALVGGVALMLRPLVWAPDPDASVQLVDGRLIGETSGYVARVDREARTVDVSASLIGWRPVVLIVNQETVIKVHDRQGGLGDLWKDMPVRASYEVIGDTRVARSIQIGTSAAEGTASSGDSVPFSTTRPAAAESRPPTPRVAEPSALRPRSDGTAIPARAPELKPPPTTPRSTAAEPPLPAPRRPAPTEVATPSSIARPVVPTEPVLPPVAEPVAPTEPVLPPPVARSVAPTETGAPPPTPPAGRNPLPERERSTAADPGDGSAVIDWLFNQSRRR